MLANHPITDLRPIPAGELGQSLARACCQILCFFSGRQSLFKDLPLLPPADDYESPSREEVRNRGAGTPPLPRSC
jgi:hypothetical protein